MKYLNVTRDLPPVIEFRIVTCKIAPGIYPYTAVNDGSCWRGLVIYKTRSAANTLDFIDKMIEPFPFPIQRIQRGRGLAFFAIQTQEKRMVHCIQLRLIKPAFSHLNGEVECSQKTVVAFYRLTTLQPFFRI